MNYQSELTLNQRRQHCMMSTLYHGESGLEVPTLLRLGLGEQRRRLLRPERSR